MSKLRIRRVIALSTLCLVGCGPPGGGGEPPSPSRGIIIQSRATDVGAKGCFEASVSYTIEPTGNPRFLSVSYQWNEARSVVAGLSPRQVTPNADGAYLVDEKFEVCPKNTRPSVQHFDFKIIAKTSTATYRSFPSVSFVKGQHKWDQRLSPTIEALKRRIDSGSRTPEVLRAYWLALAQYFHGGVGGFRRHIAQRVSRLIRQFSVHPDGGVIKAARQLLLDNGEHADVSFDVSTGLVSEVTLNESYQLGRAYENELMDLLTRGTVGVLVGLDPEDNLEAVAFEQTSSTVYIRYQRYRIRSSGLAGLALRCAGADSHGILGQERVGRSRPCG